MSKNNIFLTGDFNSAVSVYLMIPLQNLLYADDPCAKGYNK